MKKVTLSVKIFIIYLIINLVVLVFFLFLGKFIAILFWTLTHNFLLTIVVTLFFVYFFVFHPVAFFVALYKKDKDTLFIIDETTGDIQYRNKEEIINFNKNDVYEIQYCIPFMRTTFSDYSKLRLLSGKEIVVSCFVPVNKILSKNKIKRTSKYVFWINEIFKT